MSLKVKALWAVLVFCMVGGTFWAQEKKGEAQSSGASSSTAAAPPSPHSYAISPEDAARKNPVRFSQASVDRGKKVYNTQCALCHGEKGDGKGDLAKEMTLTLPDLTKPDALAKRTDGELFAIVGTGKDGPTFMECGELPSGPGRKGPCQVDGEGSRRRKRDSRSTVDAPNAMGMQASIGRSAVGTPRRCRRGGPNCMKGFANEWLISWPN
jgi:mono/diheme cytochrome c family protein